MSLLGNLVNKAKTKLEDSNEDMSKMASDTAVNIIKKLSGSNIKNVQKVVDNIVVVSGASGGVGASTIVSNIATIASKKNFNVLVIDLNIMYPVQYSYFGIKQSITKTDLVRYLNGQCTLGEGIDTTKKVSVFYANNRSLNDSIDCDSDTAVENFNNAIDKLRQLYDLILIDAPMRLDNTLINNAFYTADQVYLVWDESISSIANTERIRKNMELSGINISNKLRIILNKRTSVNYGDTPFKQLNVELISILPFDIEIVDSGLRAQVFCDKAATSSDNANIFYDRIVELTDKILQNGGYIDNGQKETTKDTDR